MSFSPVLNRHGMRPESWQTTETPLRGRWLLIARGAWLAVALLAVALVVVAIPIEFVRLQQLCISGNCEHPHLTLESLRELQSLGLSMNFFAIYFITMTIIFVLVCFATGAGIFWRKSDDRMALFVALLLVAFGSTFATSPDTLAAAASISSADRGLQVVVDVPERLPPLSAAVEVAAYRIVQEALTNVVKHARARSCRVRLAVYPQALELEVADDGVGLPLDRHIGIGLHSMRERAEELGGTCGVEPVEDGGTRVRARLPLS